MTVANIKDEGASYSCNDDSQGWLVAFIVYWSLLFCAVTGVLGRGFYRRRQDRLREHAELDLADGFDAPNVDNDEPLSNGRSSMTLPVLHESVPDAEGDILPNLGLSQPGSPIGSHHSGDDRSDEESPSYDPDDFLRGRREARESPEPHLGMSCSSSREKEDGSDNSPPPQHNQGLGRAVGGS